MLLPIRRSRALDVALGGAYLLVALGFALARMPIPVKLGLALILALSLFRRLRTRQDLPQALKLLPDGSLTCVGADGSPANWRIDSTTTVLPWLVVLRLRGPTSRRTLVLPRDALGTEAHRQLRVWLRWRTTGDSA